MSDAPGPAEESPPPLPSPAADPSPPEPTMSDLTKTNGSPATSGATAAGVPLSGPALDVLRAWVGGVFCVVFATWQHPRPLNDAWGEALLLLAPLALIPLSIVILQKSAPAAARYPWALIERFELSAATVLIGAYLLVPEPSTALLTLPWLFITMLFAWCGLLGLVKREYRDLATVTIDVGCILLAVGGLWITAERAGLRIWGFDPTISLLTGVHFHYAGFLLLLATGWSARELGMTRLTKAACWGVLVGVPLTAAGIVAAHTKLSDGFEAFAACFMAAAGVLVAVVHLNVAGKAAAPQYVKVLWTVAAAALTAGMALAALYGLRHYTKPLLDIPHMRALHGTLNALGFAFCATIAWRLHRRGLVRS